MCKFTVVCCWSDDSDHISSHNDITGTDVINDNNDITENDGPDDTDDDRAWTMGAGGGAL